ncbi:hypothetical protein RGQ29_018666 [Quercus rubra]|uniref:Uncharacterized protein n=1 Tax=Quercus rubra TaxID=3512 RepID=A0AAN7IZC6_QUERU|nr:hypothetical protein RGQ29_018666 [Quercus rubra]
MINLQVCYLNYILNILFLLVLFLPTIYGDCMCDDSGNTGNNKSAALKYKLGSIASILVASAVGASIPLLGRRFKALRPENDFFFIIKAFAAGVILATGFIHAFTDEEKDNEHEGHIHVHTHTTHGHTHISTIPSEGINSEELTRHCVIAQVLESGIVFHSVIIGVDMGASQSVATIRPLLVALSFHQFFEGVGLGGCIAQAQFKSKSAAIMSFFFSLTTPLGIVVGTFNALAAGILIYMALVDLLAADFMNPRLQSNLRIQLGSNVSLLLGLVQVGCMALIAKWA